MLTIDRVLEKCRSKAAVNLLRNYVPSADVEGVIAARRRWWSNKVEQEPKMESLRQALLAK